jgi:hypothetical protein
MPSRVFFGVAACIAAWMTAGCATPWGPGYTIEKQRIEVTYAREKPDRVSVRAWYQLKNTGKEPLSTISMEIPYLPQFTQDVRAEWKASPLQSAPVAVSDHQLQFNLGSSWKRAERGEFVLTYELKVVDPGVPVVARSGPPFFLPSGDWYPVLIPPSGTFSELNPPPNKWDLIVSVPQGYHVYASGRAAGTDRSSGKNANGASGLRFEQRTLIDFNPFVAAGPYVEQQVKTANGIVMLWSSKPVPEKRAREISERMAFDAKYFAAEFGLKETMDLPIWIIECPPLDPSEPLINLNKGCNSVPRSVSVTEYQDGLSASGPRYIIEDRELAGTWFQNSSITSPDDLFWLRRGAQEYASDSAGAVHDATHREWAITTGLSIVLSSRKNAEKPLLAIKREDTATLRGMASFRIALFFFALEDRCGEKNVHRALARVLCILRGKTWGVSDLRAAMEAECGGADLADFFREWLSRPGIPEDFRTRYSGAAPAKSPGPSN